MRRTVPFVVTAVTAVIAALAVFVGVGLGQPTSSHGGTPSDVYMLTGNAPEECAPIGVNSDGVDFMELEVDLEATSHLLVYFSFEWSDLASGEQGEVDPRVDGASPDANRFTGYGAGGLVTDSVMTAFPDVAAGPHTVDVYAAVASLRGRYVPGPLFALLGSCVLTVFVIPAVQ